MSVMRSVLFGALLGSFAIVAPLAQAGTPSDTLVVARNIGSIKSFDPAAFSEYAGAEIIASLYDRLFEIEPSDPKTPAPRLADRWEVSADGLTYRFHMRQGVTFSSGNPVTANDAVYSLQRIATIGQVPGQLLSQIGITKANCAEALRAVSDQEFTMVLPKPYSPDLVIKVLSAGLASVVDSKVVKENEKDGDLGQTYLATHSAGAGPYVLRAWLPSQSVTLQRNDKFWRPAPKIKRIVFRHTSEPSSQRLLLEKGDVDMARDLPADQVAEMAKNPDLRVDSFSRAALNYLALNQKNKELAKPQIREAITHLIDFDGMESTFLKGQRKVLQSFWPSGLDFAVDTRPYTFDIEAAKKLLAEAGDANGLDLKLTVMNSFPYPQIAQSLQSTFAKANVRLTLETSDFLTAMNRFRAHEFDLVLADWGTSYPDINVNANWFVIGSGDLGADAAVKTIPWRTGYYNAEVSKMATDAALIADKDRRAAAYRTIQERFQQEYPMIIMFQYVDQVVQRANVKGFFVGPTFDAISYEGVTK